MPELSKWKVVAVKTEKCGRRVYHCPQCPKTKRHFEIYFLENFATQQRLKMCEDHAEDFFFSLEPPTEEEQNHDQK